ncbi:hypothetical protein NRE35_004400 [Salmonella enterica]|nr:hypothetical protein [Escherichia coli]EJO2544034.1 hypothetical protein [Salmonella enterica]ELF5188697.1 hypothetical protein [Salmonella enterica]
METKNKVRIYGCGGSGTNILNLLMKQDTSNLAEFDPVFVDSSDSNIAAGSNVYRINGMNGAGKDREVMMGPARREATNILVQHEPAEVNILISSGGGATGAVVATTLAEEIWAQGKRVIFFVVGSNESLKTAENTSKHLRTLNGVARQHGHVSVVFYDNNGDNTRRAEVDRSMVQGLLAFLDLYSGNHDELDTKDVENWLFLEKSAQLEPQLVLMDIDTSRENALERQYPISVAIIHSKADAGKGTIPADYTTEGYRRDNNDTSLFFSIHTEGLNNIMAELTDVIGGFKKRAVARQATANQVFGGGTGWDL